MKFNFLNKNKNKSKIINMDSILSNIFFLFLYFIKKKEHTTFSVSSHWEMKAQRPGFFPTLHVKENDTVSWRTRALKTVKTVQIQISKQEKYWDPLRQWLIETKTGSFIWDPFLPPPETLISPLTPPPIPIFSHRSALSTTNLYKYACICVFFSLLMAEVLLCLFDQVRKLYELCKSEESDDLLARVYPQINKIFQRLFASVSQSRTSNGLLFLVCSFCWTF